MYIYTYIYIYIYIHTYIYIARSRSPRRAQTSCRPSVALESLENRLLLCMYVCMYACMHACMHINFTTFVSRTHTHNTKMNNYMFYPQRLSLLCWAIVLESLENRLLLYWESCSSQYTENRLHIYTTICMYVCIHIYIYIYIYVILGIHPENRLLLYSIPKHNPPYYICTI